MSEDTLRKPPTRRVDPDIAATNLWHGLKRYQPAIAGALAIHLRTLADDWPQRELGVGREAAVYTIPPPLRPGDNLLPEAAPHSADVEECQACAEAGLVCRWHDGQAAAHEWWNQHARRALAADPNVRLEDVLLHQEAEAAGTACVCRLCKPPAAPTRPSWWRRALRSLTHLLED
ncbi:hypothetical protein [Streptomyces longwoodensis]|uniref:hypothetical protein n=1 Tax=Streptomyces longwoodensis TaxID=68231 RepID=UPI0022520D54|nr:hypothetical protein [Streptomyces longwoodensis]MCX5000919.1 hypothetical protein [Streptomyces longwoodensis]